MRLWLFDILACPIDKYFPLKLYIFSFETKSEDFDLYLKNYQEKDLNFIKKENIIEILEDDNKLLIKDNIIIDLSQIPDYFETILKSINELENIYDRSTYSSSKTCFELIRKEIKKKINNFSKSSSLKVLSIAQIDEILPELYFLNKIKIETDIESGLLFCPKCYRWYPIIESIPQMLPDEYRNKEEDLKFLKTIKNLLDDEFIKQNLKPYNV